MFLGNFCASLASTGIAIIGMPSLVILKRGRISFLKIHMPLWLSFTFTMKRTRPVVESTQFPTLCFALIAPLRAGATWRGRRTPKPG